MKRESVEKWTRDQQIETENVQIINRGSKLIRNFQKNKNKKLGKGKR